jgi:hypothetical protein
VQQDSACEHLVRYVTCAACAGTEWAHRCHICTGTALIPATYCQSSAPELRSSRPHLHQTALIPQICTSTAAHTLCSTAPGVATALKIPDSRQLSLLALVEGSGLSGSAGLRRSLVRRGHSRALLCGCVSGTIVRGKRTASSTCSSSCVRSARCVICRSRAACRWQSTSSGATSRRYVGHCFRPPTVSGTAVDRHSLRQPFRGWVGGLSRRSLQNPLGALD